MSAPNQLRLLVRNIQISRTQIDGTSPDVPTNLVAHDASTSAKDLKMKVNFTMPTTSLNGDALPQENLTALITANDTTITTQGMPGTQVEIEMKAVAKMNSVKVKCQTANGKEGMIVTTECFCGPDAPGQTGNVVATISDDHIFQTFQHVARGIFDNYLGDGSTMPREWVADEPVNGTLPFDMPMQELIDGAGVQDWSNTTLVARLIDRRTGHVLAAD